MKRRDFLKLAAATALAGCATTPSKARVVVIGGGFGGATAAKYIRMWDPSIDVVLVEREASFVSCPISNLVLGGFSSMEEITRSQDTLERHGVQLVRDEAVGIDAAKKTVRLARGGEIAYERLIVSPGVGVDANAMSGKLEVEDVKGDVLNVVPPHRAGDIAAKAGLITTNNRWCDVDWRTMASKAVKGVHVLGDATLSAPAMHKSASMANNHAKIAAAAIVELLNGRNPAPL